MLCAREAAHMIYFTIARAKQSEPMRSKIWYDPVIADYTGHLAAVQLLDLPAWVPGKFNDWLYKIVRGHTAGGVVARKLNPLSDRGDKDDRERFRKLCDKFNEDPNVSVKCDYWWNLAQETITEDLTHPEVMDQISQEVLRVRPLLGF